MSLQSTDPIADLLTRIRNAGMVGKTTVSLPHSNFKERIAQSLKTAGYIAKLTVDKDQKPATLEITINDAITEITRMSKPGRRLYVAADEIPKVKNGRGIVLLSTSKGVMTGDEAKKARLGGEVLFKVY